MLWVQRVVAAVAAFEICLDVAGLAVNLAPLNPEFKRTTMLWIFWLSVAWNVAETVALMLLNFGPQFAESRRLLMIFWSTIGTFVTGVGLWLTLYPPGLAHEVFLVLIEAILVIMLILDIVVARQAVRDQLLAH